MCFPQKTIGKLRISILFFVCNCHTQFLYFGLVRFADVCTFWCQDGQSSEAQTLGWWNLRPVFLVSKKAMGPQRRKCVSCKLLSKHWVNLKSAPKILQMNLDRLICFSWASFFSFKAKVASTQQAVEVTHPKLPTLVWCWNSLIRKTP